MSSWLQKTNTISWFNLKISLKFIYEKNFQQVIYFGNFFLNVWFEPRLRCNWKFRKKTFANFNSKLSSFPVYPRAFQCHSHLCYCGGSNQMFHSTEMRINFLWNIVPMIAYELYRNWHQMIYWSKHKSKFNDV